jgi:hypothetical protein
MLTGQKHLDQSVEEWRKGYDFHCAELQFDIDPNPSFNPSLVRIAGTMNPELNIALRPRVKQVFPATKFVDKNYKVDGILLLQSKQDSNHLKLSTPISAVE